MRSAIAVCAILLAVGAANAVAFTDEEHRHLALRAFAPQLGRLGVTVTADALAEITVRTSRDDMASARFHVRGRTPYEQAAAIAPERLAQIVAEVVERPPTERAFMPFADNVVANYQAYHAIAMGCARQTHEPSGSADVLEDRSVWAETALVYEAVALGYLADAFSSSHLLTPIHLPLARLQRTNVRAAHDFFVTQGAYVCNGAGEMWQTFGDGLLRWYGPAYEHALAAVTISVADVAEVIEPSHTPPAGRPPDGLDLIPMVVAATWRHGEQHYPQFREPGLHNPSLRVDTRFLYSRHAVPPKLVPQVVVDGDPAGLIRHDPLIASVEYHQTRDVAPAFAGVLLMTGGGALVKADGGGGVGSVAVGRGWEFPMPLLARLRTSFETAYLYRLGDPDRRVVVPRYTIGIGSPALRLVEAIHFEVGYAWGLRSPFKDQGVKWGVGFGTRPFRLPSTYAGVSLRLQYERFWMDQVLDGFQLVAVLR